MFIGFVREGDERIREWDDDESTERRNEGANRRLQRGMSIRKARIVNFVCGSVSVNMCKCACVFDCMERLTD